jgi:5-methylcytosine-specific restriction endonuclease McrA
MSDIIKTQRSLATKAMHQPAHRFDHLYRLLYNEVWREIKAQVKAERGARCERCGTTVHLDLHHRQARRYGGHDTIDNAELLCRPCHVQTPTYGDHRRLQ